jgi:hypothetical protein
MGIVELVARQAIPISPHSFPSATQATTLDTPVKPALYVGLNLI